VKTSLFASILLSTLFYTNLLSTLFVMSLGLAAREEAGMATAAGHGQVWERSVHAPANMEPHGDLRLPRLPQVDGPAARFGGPDAAMIKPGKARAKSIKV